MTGDEMIFPDTFDEFADAYGLVDTEEVYTNGSQLIPVFRVKQWLEHINPQPKIGRWIPIDDFPYEVWECDHCGFVIDGSGCIEPTEYRDMYNYCPNCGADMRGET